MRHAGRGAGHAMRSIWVERVTSALHVFMMRYCASCDVNAKCTGACCGRKICTACTYVLSAARRLYLLSISVHLAGHHVRSIRTAGPQQDGPARQP